MKPYFTKHCAPSCGEQCKANAPQMRTMVKQFARICKVFVQCTVHMHKHTYRHAQKHTYVYSLKHPHAYNKQKHDIIQTLT